jgi:hypothetical protein
MSNYPWAANQLKLNQAEEYLKNAKKLNSTIVIDEQSIKDAYVKRGGLLVQPTEVVVDQVVEVVEEVAKVIPKKKGKK